MKLNRKIKGALAAGAVALMLTAACGGSNAPEHGVTAAAEWCTDSISGDQIYNEVVYLDVFVNELNPATGETRQYGFRKAVEGEPYDSRIRNRSCTRLERLQAEHWQALRQFERDHAIRQSKNGR